ncbi:restriction endonuclease subunit S [Salmonella enterica]|nr:restriction endonuclease subunit S [Salmonella enterica]ELD3847421.1 restriction endonuclease subunit S [Salmonella enterica]ELQ9144681.1 restriction endonuclease subunit S [Salmonella enterica]ELR5956459.1 restriction endonuclease subunit S [Salmonella enterica]VEA95724.1 EcoKI restriction-modification system protein HsdS [Salmonella enterica subsp. houtenae]
MSDLMPKEWILGKASDFVVSPKNDIVDGPFGSNLKASEYQLSGTPIIRLQNIKRLCFINKNIKYVSNEKAIELSRHSYKKGDIVITKLGDPLGLACIIPENFQDGVIVADLVRLRINDLAFDKRYLTYLLNSPFVISQLNKHIKGTTRPRINLGIIRDLNLPIASIFEQKIIAEKLDMLLTQVDSTKARLEQIPQILKRFRQAVLTVAMSGELTEEWRKINSILFSSWVNSNIGELAQVATGKTPKRTEVKYWENGSIPWLTSSSTGEIYAEVAEQFITPIALKECTIKIFSPGTLLLAMYGEGKTRGQVTELKIHAACNQACAAIICDKEKIDLQFLKMRLMENYQETRKAAAGGNQPNLNLNKVREIPVIVPPLPEQHEIVRRVEQLFAYADTIEKQVNNALTRVNNLTQSILAKAFRGELTAQWRAENPSLISGENSAAALLKKIKAERAASGGKKNSRKKA